MRKYTFLFLFFVVLVTPFVVQRVVHPTNVGPRAEGSVRLTVMTSHNQDIRNEFAAAFDRWHREHYQQSAELVFLSPGGGGEMRRYLESFYAGKIKDGKVDETLRPDVEMVWGGGDFFFDVEIKKFLQPVDVSEQLLKTAFAEPSLAGVRLYDFGKNKDGTAQRPKWIGVCMSSFGIIYNPDVYKLLKIPAPTMWTDLTRPELNGWIAMANPASSSSAAVSYSMVLQRAMADEEELILARRPELKALSTADRMKDAEYKAAIAKGWRTGNGTLLLIAGNARYFTDSGTQPPNDVANGEAAAGMAIDFYGRVYEETAGKDRLRFLEPAAATALNPDPIAVALGVKGEQYKLANRFIEYLLTPEAQKIWIQKPGSVGGPERRSLRRPPIRRDLYGDRSLWTDPDLNPFQTAGDFNRRSEWDTLFTDTRLMWAAAWIDGREQLKSAYRAVLAVPEAARREQLLAELAVFPMTMGDLEKVQAERRKQPDRELGEWRAKKRVELAALFRTHFQKVEADAKSAVVSP